MTERSISAIEASAMKIFRRWYHTEITALEAEREALDLGIHSIEFQANAVAFNIENIKLRIKHTELRK